MALELGKVKVDDLVENNYKILGIGINERSQNNGIFSVNYTTLEQAKDNLRNLILTKKGERLMQPDFGCDIWKLLFEPLSTDIEQIIENSIVSAVSYWLPYLNVETIIFDYDEKDIDKNTIALEITFSLLSNPNMRDTINVIVKQ